LRANADYNLGKLNPDLVTEWNSIKNGSLSPYDVSPRSHKNYWWKCSRGHEWEATPANRGRGTGCPLCHPQTSGIELRVYCEFEAIFQNVRWREKIDDIEVDVYLPEYKVGLEVDGYPWHYGHEERDTQKGDLLLKKGLTLFRLRDKRLKPISSTDILFNSRESHLTIIMKTLRNLMLNVGFSDNDCTKVSEYLYLNQFQNDVKYKNLIGLLPSPVPEKSLANLFPKLAEEWDIEKNSPLTPIMVHPKSHLRVWWKCPKNHRYDSTVDHRTGGRGCPKCKFEKIGEVNRIAAVKNNHSLADEKPNLASEWHPTKNDNLTPFTVSPRSNKKVWWLCSKSHSWSARVSNRACLGRGCPYCAGQRVTEENNLAVKYPNIAKEWHPTKNSKLMPQDVFSSSGRKFWWLCSQGHEWVATVNNRTHNGRGCPFCSGQRPSKENNLAVKSPELAKQWHPTKNGDLTPCEVTLGSGKKVWLLCSQGHELKAEVYRRVKGSGCPKCRVERRRQK
jgi:hypothetical protein